MKEKKMFSAEAAYIAGILILALGTAFMEKADFGLSMVVAPAYLFYLKISQTIPWFTFGMSEYCFQAVLLVLITVIMKRFKAMYLFSFVTAFIYGVSLDLMMGTIAAVAVTTVFARAVFFVLGALLGSLGVALLFHTYIAPEAYELMVKEISVKTGWDISKVKTGYDICSCLISVILSFLFFGFGHFEGIKAGTFLCALTNGWLIGKNSAFLDRTFEFHDALKLRHYFE